MALPSQTTLTWTTEADFDALADVMFATVREGESLYTEAQRQACVPEPRRGSAWRTRLLSQEIMVAEADEGLLVKRSVISRLRRRRLRIASKRLRNREPEPNSCQLRRPAPKHSGPARNSHLLRQ